MIVNVEVGYKVTEDKQPTKYYFGASGNGLYYKDYSAWENNSDICYIPEYEFKGHGAFRVESSALGYIREEIIQIVQDEIDWNYPSIPVGTSFENQIARSIFYEASGESIGAILDRIDLDEEWKYYCINNEILSK